MRKRTAVITAGVTAAAVAAVTIPMAVGADQVFLDDLIVNGSACVGQDCNNGESFGFDTIRLKENNLRLRFQDTSNSASFPTNDWQLTANSSDNGGGNFFAIDDIDGGRTPFKVEAGAPTDSLRIDDSGRIGLGTDAPVVEMHMASGDSPTVRLEQDGTSGFTPQTWDLAGNEANFFVRDVTNGSRLPFKIKPGAPTDSLFVAADGDIGLGDDSPTAQLDVLGSTEQPVIQTTMSGAGSAESLRLARSGGSNILSFADVDNESFWRFLVTANGNVFSFQVDDGSGIKTPLRARNTGSIQLATFATAPTATPLAGEVYLDTSGGFCVAFASGTWTNLNSTGDCT